MSTGAPAPQTSIADPLSSRDVRPWAQLICDHSPAGVAALTLDGRVIESNRAFATFFGYSEDEMRGVSFGAVTHPDDMARSRAFWRRIHEQPGDTARIEKRYIHRDGRILWAELSAAVVRDAAGDPTCLIANIIDINDRKRMEDALRTSEYFFKESQRVGCIGSYKVDLASGTWESSEVLDGIFGISPDFERTVAAWVELVHPLDRAATLEHLAHDVMEQRRPFNREYRIVRKADGETRWVSGRGELGFDESAKVLSMIGTIQDITERKSSENAVQVGLERHRAILRTAMDGFWLIGVDGRLLEVNDTYSEMSGYSLSELCAMTISDLEASESPEDTATHLANIIRCGQDRFESRHRRKDGSLFDVEVSAQYRPLEGGGVVVAFVRDISSRKKADEERSRLEAQLRQAQKMESVGRLAGGVAHDFNNMIGAILGYSELAIEQVPPSAPVHADLIEIRKAAERSAELTRQLLAFARKQTVSPKPIDLSDTVAGMQRMLQRLLGEGIELVVRPGPGVWPVRMDPSQFDEILVNLCVNSRDAMGQQGTITIEISNVTLSPLETAKHSVAAGDYVRVVVTDTGSGMDQSTLAHMFEPFFTTKDVGRGTGLGLATVYGAVRQNEGFVSVTSEIGRGTAFTICLPRHRGEAEPTRPPATGEAIVGGGEAVLLVEDEPAILTLLENQLQRLGYRVIAVSSPREAQLRAKAHPGRIDLLITDVVMPGMNGLDLANSLRENHPHLARLFMSGYTAEVIAHHGVLEDGVHFIQKPFTSTGMAAKVREALDGRPAAASRSTAS